MAYKKTLPVKLLSFVFVFVLLFMPVMTIHSKELYDDYTGTFTFVNNFNLTYLNFLAVNDTSSTTYSFATYKGSTQNLLRFWQSEGYVYTGQATVTATFTFGNTDKNIVNNTIVDVTMRELQIPQGINVVMEYVKRNSNETTVRYRIIFNNYQATYSGYTYLSWINDYVASVTFNTKSYSNYVLYQTTSELSYREALFEYQNFVDVPSYEGENNRQNEQMIQNQQEANQLQEEANDLQREANETSSGILSKITEFFSGFFTNLGNTVLSWIVPTSDQLTALLNEVNSWFSARLGFVWYPFDLAIKLVNALAGGSANTKITIPALSLNMLGGTYQIWNAIEIDIDASGIFKYVRYFTDVILVAGVAKLAYDKWDEWIGGHGVG